MSSRYAGRVKGKRPSGARSTVADENQDRAPWWTAGRKGEATAVPESGGKELSTHFEKDFLRLLQGDSTLSPNPGTRSRTPSDFVRDWISRTWPPGPSAQIERARPLMHPDDRHSPGNGRSPKTSDQAASGSSPAGVTRSRPSKNLPNSLVFSALAHSYHPGLLVQTETFPHQRLSVPLSFPSSLLRPSSNAVVATSGRTVKSGNPSSAKSTTFSPSIQTS